MIVQIYEIQEPGQAELCIASGVDHIGSVLLSRDEWRKPSVKDVIRISEGTGIKNSLIPLFDDLDILERCLDYYRPDYLHFCDSLTNHLRQPVDLGRIIELQCALKESFPETGIIRSIPIPTTEDAPGFPTLELAQALEPASDLFLIDTWLEEQPVEGFIGITGRTADWGLCRKLVCRSAIPVILAGGLSPENVFEALLEICPSGADSCSRTNKVDRDGKVIRFQKDFKRVKEFVQAVRRAEKAIGETTEGLGKRAEVLER